MTLLNAQQTSMNQLAVTLGISKANASGLVDRLAKKRLVVRHRSAEDRRVIFVQLTPSGIKTARQLVKLNRRGLVRMMRRIPDDNLKVFIDTLEQLAHSLLTKP